MKMNQLGRTDLQVSAYCLGSMTWGTQNTEEEGHAQIDRALSAGINIIDTAEMYPVNPLSAETQGRTEEIIGTWLAKTGRRSDVILATKHSGNGVKYIRDGAAISAKSVPEAVEGSLKRLQTDYIDLYQLHWPNRGSYMFRQNWNYDPSKQNRVDTLANMHEVLEALDKEVKRGTIRHVGLSNESAWGTAQWLRLSEDQDLPRMQSIQNEYSLMCRMFDTDLAELSVNEDVGLLAFSPLAAGYLSGKYQGGAVPKGSRMDLNGNLGGRKTDRAFAAVDAYLALAAEHEMSLVQMAMAWSVQRPFVTSSIFGATSLEQLDQILSAVELTLSDELMQAINAVHKEHPMPY